MPKLPKKQADIKELPSKRAKKVRATTSLQVAQFLLSCIGTGAVIWILVIILALQ